MTSDTCALQLGATDREIELTDRFTGCFVDQRCQALVEYEIAALVDQRVLGISLGYEDLTDYDGAAIEGLFVNAHETPPKRVVLYLDAADDPMHRDQEGKFF